MKNIAGNLAVPTIIILDQLTKYGARVLLETPINVTNFFSFQLIYNTGASFGIFQNSNLPLIFVSIAIIAGLIYYVNKESLGNTERLLFSLIIAGAISNLIDRILFSAVTDFIYFHFWPAFNVADSAITVGVVGLIIHSFRGNKK